MTLAELVFDMVSSGSTEGLLASGQLVIRSFTKRRLPTKRVALANAPRVIRVEIPNEVEGGTTAIVAQFGRALDALSKGHRCSP